MLSPPSILTGSPLGPSSPLGPGSPINPGVPNRPGAPGRPGGPMLPAAFLHSHSPVNPAPDTEGKINNGEMCHIIIIFLV